VEFTYEPNLLTQQPDTVTVRVYGENQPAAAALRERIRSETGVDVGVRVVTEQISRA